MCGTTAFVRIKKEMNGPWTLGCVYGQSCGAGKEDPKKLVMGEDRQGLQGGSAAKGQKVSTEGVTRSDEKDEQGTTRYEKRWEPRG